jgi:hypothetical protein
MLKLGRKPRLTYANVMSTGALFVALGGVSYAASGALAPGSVGTRQLRNGAVTPAKLAFGFEAGGFSNRSDQEIYIGQCPRGEATCARPNAEQRIAKFHISLTRRTRLMITAHTVVQNFDTSQSANVSLDDGGGPCFSVTIVPPRSIDTVSCSGSITLKPGNYRLGIFSGAQGTRTEGIRASAEHASVAWWTLPPSKH